MGELVPFPSAVQTEPKPVTPAPAAPVVPWDGGPSAVVPARSLSDRARRTFAHTARAAAHPATGAVAHGVWAGSGGLVHRAGRFFLAADELERSNDSQRQSGVQKKRAIGALATAVVVEPGGWLAERLITGSCEFVTLHAAPWALGALALGTGVAAARRRYRAVTLAAETITDDAGASFEVKPLSAARVPQDAARFLQVALLAVSSGKLRADIEAATEANWGYTVTLRLRTGKPADVIKLIEDLEVRLNIGANRCVVSTQRDARARLVFRLVARDPFAQLPAVPMWSPGSRSIADPMPLALRLDGTVLSAGFQATHGVVVAASGGGKSILLRLVVDGLAACRDAVLWDLDPSGVGQAPQRPMMGRVALSPESVKDALRDALEIARARTRLLPALDMGDEWTPSPDHPALVLFLDEYPQLDAEGQDLAVRLLRVARKAGVVLIFASQSATKDAIGSSIAASVAFKACGPGVAVHETRLLFGESATSEGYMPHKLVPKRGPQLNDAGTFFIDGAREGGEPMPARVLFLDNAAAATRAQAFAQVMTVLDDRTLSAAGLSRDAVEVVTSDVEASAAREQAARMRVVQADRLDGRGDVVDAELVPEVPKVLALLADVLEDHETGVVPTAELAARLGYADEDRETAAQRLGRELRAAGVQSPPKRRMPGYENAVSVQDLGVIRAAMDGRTGA